MVARLVQGTFGEILRHVVSCLVGVGVGMGGQGTVCSIIFVAVASVIAMLPKKSKFARIFRKHFSSAVVIGVVNGAMATQV